MSFDARTSRNLRQVEQVLLSLEGTVDNDVTRAELPEFERGQVDEMTIAEGFGWLYERFKSKGHAMTRLNGQVRSTAVRKNR